MKKGFTLIELLVVVLIVGILASFALPQYETAVLRSRLGTVMTNVRRIHDALDVYMMTKGEYPSDGDLSLLDADISGCTVAGDTITCQNEVYKYGHDADNTPIGGFPNNKGIAYVQYPTMGYPVAKRDTRECWAAANNKYAIQACASYSDGDSIGSSSWNAPAGTSWVIYPQP